jgi:hypothetical protein
MVEMLLHGILSNQIVIAKVAPSPLQRIDEKEKRKKKRVQYTQEVVERIELQLYFPIQFCWVKDYLFLMFLRTNIRYGLLFLVTVPFGPRCFMCTNNNLNAGR